MGAINVDSTFRKTVMGRGHWGGARVILHCMQERVGIRGGEEGDGGGKVGLHLKSNRLSDDVEINTPLAN